MSEGTMEDEIEPEFEDEYDGNLGEEVEMPTYINEDELEDMKLHEEFTPGSYSDEEFG